MGLGMTTDFSSAPEDGGGPEDPSGVEDIVLQPRSSFNYMRLMGNPARPLDLASIKAGAHHGKVEMRKEREDYVAPNLPLFRFGALKDAMGEMTNIKDRVIFKVFSNLVEIIVMEKADEYDLAMAMWLLSHATGHLMINTPVPDNPKKLLHIANVTKETRIRDLVFAIVGNIITHPAHLVLQTKFNLEGSVLASPLMNKHTLARVYTAVKNDYIENKI